MSGRIPIARAPYKETAMRKALALSVVVFGLAAFAPAAEIHVSLKGRDSNPGTPSAPLRTIQRAADLALPGDVITVHAGVYRERIVPPRGGSSEAKRIVYQAAPGEKVEIAGSEIVKPAKRAPLVLAIFNRRLHS